MRWAAVVAAMALVVASACAQSVEDGLVAPELGIPETSPPPKNACVETKCPAPFATCPGSGPCTVDLRSDVLHCGSCEKQCPKGTRSNGTFLCVEGTCEIACAPSYGDCNGDVVDGCETPLGKDPKNCGGCGITCAEGDICWKGACGCPKGFTACGDECKKLDADDDNCTACGTLCRAPTDDADPRWTCGSKVTPANTKWTCAESSCSLRCKPLYGDCNDNFCGDGCEVDLGSDPANCGACGHACDPGQACVQGTCLCPPGTILCGGECVDTARDPLNCGACGYTCPGAWQLRAGKPGTGGGPLCEGGECRYVCYPGFADCDKDIDNGCEVDLRKDQRNCGACGTSCDVKAGQPCVAGQCLTKPCEIGPVR